MGRPARKKRLTTFSLICIGLSALLGLFLLSKRLEAQPKGKAPPLAAPLPAALPSAPPKATDGADAGAAAPAKKEEAEPAKADKGKDDKDELPAEDALNSATVQPNGSLVHTKGPFKSPFANPDFGKAAEVKVGLQISQIMSYDIKEGTFDATFYLSLTSATPMPDHLNLAYPNGKIDNVYVMADRPTFKLYRINGTFRSPPDLRKYPFDSQELTIQIEENSKGVDQLKLVPDEQYTRFGANFEIAGWDLKYLEARSLSRDMPPRFENDDLYYGRYICRIGIARFGASAIFSVYVPALVIVVIGLLAMWVTPDEMEVRSNGGAPMLAGAVLFHFSLIQSIPATAYLTKADKLMVGVYLSLLMNMISTWFFFVVDEENHDKVFKIARVLVPVLTLILMIFVIVV
ncbi:MAG: hypothetical protein IPK71_29720 [Myxococcales bacterium]|nr:hypothetical protein [Myxococcales bacterium]